jgi:hypothetical protein
MKLKTSAKSSKLTRWFFEADDQISLIDNKSQTTAGMSFVCLFFKNLIKFFLCTVVGLDK